MDAYMVILRLLHIFAGIYWVGAAFLFASAVGPSLRALGPDGTKFSLQFYGHSLFNKLMPLASLITTVSGLLLYYEVSDGFNADWMNSSGGVVLSIGAVAGILAFGHGAGAIGPKSGQYEKIAKEIGTADPTLEQGQQLAELSEYIGKHSMISLVMMIVAVAGMAAARYV